MYAWGVADCESMRDILAVAERRAAGHPGDAAHLPGLHWQAFSLCLQYERSLCIEARERSFCIHAIILEGGLFRLCGVWTCLIVFILVQSLPALI